MYICAFFADEECSGQGVCNEKTGECKCAEGFSGRACQRQACPVHNCFGHGTCEWLAPDYNVFIGCKCDPGYFGSDCFQRVCPRGDDPTTPWDKPSIGYATQKNQHIYTVTATVPDVTGWYTLTFTTWYGRSCRAR